MYNQLCCSDNIQYAFVTVLSCPIIFPVVCEQVVYKRKFMFVKLSAPVMIGILVVFYTSFADHLEFECFMFIVPTYVF